MRRVAASLEDARRELVDVSRRNRLLHTPRAERHDRTPESADEQPKRQRRSHCLEFVDADPDAVFAGLRDGKAFGFDPLGTGELDLGARDEGSVEVAHRQRTGRGRSSSLRLRTGLNQDILDRRLLRFFREARVIEEEQGVNILFLVLGFLKWFEDARSDQVTWAPLILYPVVLERRAGADQFVLRGRDEDLVVNVSLRERLRLSNGIDLPDLPEEDEWRPSTYFNDVAHAAAGETRWSIDCSACGLGFFTFSKFLMWRDLHPSSWPDPRGLLAHPTIGSLLGESEGRFVSDPLPLGEDERIDDKIDLAAAVHVLDADSSQATAIEETRRGSDLVIQGPPGTGKSQTIANVIATAVHAGRTVLFVAEKAAALEVVHSRLRNVGLDVACLELHSRKATKLAVLTSLQKTLYADGAASSGELISKQLRQRRDQLNTWAKLLHRPIGNSGRTPYEVMGRVLKLHADKVRVLTTPLPRVEDWDRDRLQAVEEAVDRAVLTIGKLTKAPNAHPWRTIRAPRLSPFDVERLRAALDEAARDVGQLREFAVAAESALRSTKVTTPQEALQLASALRLLTDMPANAPTIYGHPAWRSDRRRLAALFEHGRTWETTGIPLAAAVSETAWEAEVGGAHRSISAYGKSPLRVFQASYRAAIADLRSLCRGDAPRGREARLKFLEAFLAAQAARRHLLSEAEFGRAALVGVWEDVYTKWESAETLLAWANRADSFMPGVDLLSIAPEAKQAAWAQLASDLEECVHRNRLTFDHIGSIIQLDFTTLLGSSEWTQHPISELAAKIKEWQSVLSEINEWISFRDAIDTARSLGASLIVDGLVDQTISSGEARQILDLLIAEGLWRKACVDEPRLNDLDGTERNDAVHEFRKLDRQRIQTARCEILTSYFNQRPQGGTGEMGIIRAEIGKKRRHLPVRRLLEQAGAAVQKLKPVFLMSPLSVAQFLPPGRLTFDLLVIDEASQVAPEDALGAVARARQIVVVGDDKQLPPTNFFRLAMSDDDEEEDAEAEPIPARARDFESILTLGRARGMRERMLQWHYRSRHPSLIAVSNLSCYGGSLLLPPSPILESDQLGLSLVKSPPGHYDRGGSGRNPAEADVVAEYVERHLVECPDLSLGVACFSVAQRNAIDDALYSRGLTSIVESFSPNGERLFIKNLETVQGDERDVIFISIGYGKDPQGRLTANFGPISQDGGERRLNVLISRARARCVVFSSIESGDIPADTRSAGTRMLRDFLYYVETGKFAAGTVTGGDFDSPFEEAVALTIARAGYDVQPQVGVSGFRVDLGVLAPEHPGRFVLGVECDGATYHSARSARDRDRLRQEVLERQGWHLYRIWSSDWFANPTREAEHLIRAIETACASCENEPPLAGTPTVSQEAPPPSEEKQSRGNLQTSALPDQVRMPIYVEHRPAVPRRRRLQELTQMELVPIVVDVVTSEGPIHLEEVARRVREAFDLDRTGNRIRSTIEGALRLATRQGRLSSQEPFWWAPGAELSLPRDRREAALSVRRADRIPPQEYELALILAITTAVAVEADELFIQAARLLGFDRTGPDLRAGLENQLKKMMEAGKVVEQSGRYTLP